VTPAISPAPRRERFELVGGQIERNTRLGGQLTDYRRTAVRRDVGSEPAIWIRVSLYSTVAAY